MRTKLRLWLQQIKHYPYATSFVAFLVLVLFLITSISTIPIESKLADL